MSKTEIKEKAVDAEFEEKKTQEEIPAEEAKTEEKSDGFKKFGPFEIRRVPKQKKSEDDPEAEKAKAEKWTKVKKTGKNILKAVAIVGAVVGGYKLHEALDGCVKDLDDYESYELPSCTERDTYLNSAKDSPETTYNETAMSGDHPVED